jgi:hypothetical protein
MPPKLRESQRIAPTPAPGPAADAGHGVDFLAVATHGTIASATGSFPSVITTGEINVASDGVTTSRKSQFALQINSNEFKADACSGSTIGLCKGWEQFELSNDPGSPPGVLWIQDWLLDYGTSCPSGWGLYGSGPDCVYNGQTVSAPIISNIQNLQTVWMEGVATASGNDTVYLGWTDGVTQAIAYSQDSKLDLAANWTQSEFNVFGDLTLHQARFDPNTSIVVAQSLTFANNTAAQPLSASSGSTTGETNLDLVQPPCVLGPVLTFKESNISNASYACPKPLNLCAAAKELVSADQKQLAKLQAALTGPTCRGPARFECTQAIKNEQTMLSAAEVEEKKGLCTLMCTQSHTPLMPSGEQSEQMPGAL